MTIETEEWKSTEGVWVITFTMPNSEVTVAGDYAIPIKAKEDMFSIDAVELARKAFPLSYFAEEIYVDFVPKGAEDYIW
tara:strand:- start:526 stop:762 length:237 start_codon:yes stop_codon:yes gene_type:complete